VTSPLAKQQLATIRAEIERWGESVVGCKELLVLVSETDAIGVQFGHVFATAEREGWSLEFRTDGTVRFANLQRATEMADELSPSIRQFARTANASG
jgi:hypothetical protein